MFQKPHFFRDGYIGDSLAAIIFTQKRQKERSKRGRPAKNPSDKCGLTKVCFPSVNYLTSPAPRPWPASPYSIYIYRPIPPRGVASIGFLVDMVRPGRNGREAQGCLQGAGPHGTFPRSGFGPGYLPETKSGPLSPLCLSLSCSLYTSMVAPVCWPVHQSFSETLRRQTHIPDCWIEREGNDPTHKLKAEPN